jgi:C1A family cysteine protease
MSTGVITVPDLNHCCLHSALAEQPQRHRRDRLKVSRVRVERQPLRCFVHHVKSALELLLRDREAVNLNALRGLAQVRRREHAAANPRGS